MNTETSAATSCPGQLELVRCELGELEPARAASIRAHVESCQKCQPRMNEFRANKASFDAQLGSHQSSLRARLATQKPSTTRWLWWAAPLAGAAAAMAVLVVKPNLPVSTPGGGGDVSYKGVVSVRAVVKRGADQFELVPSQPGERVPLHPADALRFIVNSATPGFVSIFGIDAQGQEFALYPEASSVTEPAPFALKSAGETALPGSFELDDSLGDESIVFVYSPKPFNRTKVHAEIRKRMITSHVTLEGMDVEIFRYVKE